MVVRSRAGRTAAMLVASGLLAGSAGGLASASRVPPFQSAQQWGASWTYNPYAPNFTNFSTLTNLPLAYLMRPRLYYTPGLASSWKVTSGAITIHLRPNAKWQNGEAVTSKDVLDTFLIGGAFYWGAWNYLTGITTPNAHTVVFHLKKGTNLAEAKQNIFTEYMVPSGLYGQFVKPGLESAILHNDTNLLNAVKTAVLKYSPTTYVGDGPFELRAMTTAQANLVKWPGFFGAAKVHVPAITMYNASSNAQGWSYMFAGKSDYAWTSLTKNLVKRWLSNPQNHLELPWDYSEFAFYFNCRKYPLNLVKVRQALAYVLNRRSLTLANNGFLKNHVVNTPTGLLKPVKDRWIPNWRSIGLNSYPNNPARAAAILKSIGFKKTAKGWVTPKGTPFTLSVTAPAGYNGSIASAEDLASELTAFGIKTTATAVEQPGFWTQQNKGQYEISWGWAGYWDLNPVDELYDVLVGENYTPHQPGYVGMGFGPDVNLPGYGKVNIAQNLTAAKNLTNPQQIRKLVTAWAKVVNQDLPFLPFLDKKITLTYSTARYVGWPSSKNVLWQQAGGGADTALALMIMDGYLHPR